jgi:hypothetical protein
MISSAFGGGGLDVFQPLRSPQSSLKPPFPAHNPAIWSQGQPLGMTGQHHHAHTGNVKCGVVCGVVWCGVVWCGVVWCGVVWCDAV